MHSLINDYQAGLLGAHEPPCLSLYQPTHRAYPENQQDPIRFKNLLKSLEQSLRQKYTTRDVKPLCNRFRIFRRTRIFGITRKTAWRSWADPDCSVFTGSSGSFLN